MPTSQIADAAAVVLNAPSLPVDSYTVIRHPLHYASEMGNRDVRGEIARWAGERYGLREEIGLERILMTSGASFGLMNPCLLPGRQSIRRCRFHQQINRHLLDRHQHRPPSLCRHLHHLNATTPDIPLSAGLAPISHDGAAPKRIYKYVLYCVPTYSNPTGQTWDLATRRELVQLAREFDVLLVSDDVYDFLGNEGDKCALGEDGKLLPRLVTVDREIMEEEGELEQGAGFTVSNCSFSKLLGPGLRCGWIETATSVLAEQIGHGGANISGGNSSHFVSTLIHHVVKTRAIDAIITTLRQTYTSRSGAIAAAIRAHLPAGTEICGGHGGFFMWVGLPPGYDARKIVRMAEEQGRRAGGEGDEWGYDRVPRGEE
ncbi:uncharacterized protein LAJ45_03321 [Morchella importuna]|uniref:uncharacterized protein n=1 Tax=Morchella importuna TaxID=1174673 RepID=UPI001E8EF12E|nr:uncharacterized protein LAJ45_03321 [Morchella importuna]KAH8152481.1 hypothetical protein LAJ45_03321 [Morchella importuna]